jgi:cytochrome d ubiquinol oxidase subunit I
MAAVLSPIQAFLGDQHGLNTLEHQPAKIAAMEGNWETQRRAPLLIFAIPSEAERRNIFEIGIPDMASLILRHDVDGIVPGLNDYPGLHPPVAPVFFAFRVMVGMGVLMIATGFTSAFFLWRRGALPRWLLMWLVCMTFGGWVATLAGWYVTEIGRQPWLVTGVLTTAQAAGPVPAGNIGVTLAMYLILYGSLLVAYIVTVFRLAGRAQAPIDETAAVKGIPA